MVATYTWNGRLGSEWEATSGTLTNWDGPGMQPIPGSSDIADFEKDATITLNSGGGGALGIDIDATVTFSSGHFQAGFDGIGRLFVDNGGTLIIATTDGVSDRGAIDEIGISQSGSLEIQAGAGFDDTGMVVGYYSGSTGDVTVDGAFFSVVEPAPGAGGVLTIGQGGHGSVEISGNSQFFAATTIVGKDAGSSGILTVNDSTWGGDSLTIGPAGTGVVTVENGSSVALTEIVIGPEGELDVTGAAGVTTTVTAPFLTLEFGTLAVSGGGEVNMSGTGVQGAVDIASTFLGLGTINGNVIVEQGGALEANVVEGGQSFDGTLTVNGSISGMGTIEPVRTFEANGAIAAGITIQFAASPPGDGVLQLDLPRDDDGTIVGFTNGNMIDVKGLVYTAAVFTPGTAGNPGVLKLLGGTDAPLQLNVDGPYSNGSFVATPSGGDTLVTLALCFCRGTLILTEHGEVPVEELAVGDRVATLSGAAKPVVWIGCGRDLVTRSNKLARPVIVRRGALADNIPTRDLYLTHGHALYLDGVLIPVENLINHHSILWDETARIVEYYHIELADHDVVLANGAPAESYYDASNRALFHNARPGSEAGKAKPTFAPVLNGGEAVERSWAMLFERAGGRIATDTTDDPDLHLVIDSRRLDPTAAEGCSYTFALEAPPAGALRLCSRSGVPSLLGISRHDHRRLGVAITQIVLLHAGIPTYFGYDQPQLREGGCYPHEDGFCWTDGNFLLPGRYYSTLDGAFVLTVKIERPGMRYPLPAPLTKAA